MANKALIFDISTKRLREDGHTDSEISRVYAQFRSELSRAGFSDRIQHSVYRTTNGDGINSLIRLIERKQEFPMFCKFKDRIHWMGCDEYSDVTGAFDLDL